MFSEIPLINFWLKSPQNSLQSRLATLLKRDPMKLPKFIRTRFYYTEHLQCLHQIIFMSIELFLIMNIPVYRAKLKQRHDITLNNFFSHVQIHALKNLYMINHRTIYTKSSSY